MKISTCAEGLPSLLVKYMKLYEINMVYIHVGACRLPY